MSVGHDILIELNKQGVLVVYADDFDAYCKWFDKTANSLDYLVSQYFFGSQPDKTYNNGSIPTQLELDQDGDR